MIPWKDFRYKQVIHSQLANWYANIGDSDCTEPEIRLPLTQRNLELYVGHGESQLQRELNSSMLELAHERRLVISQLSLHHVHFNNWHLLRVEDALHQMFNQFDRNRKYDDSGPLFKSLDVLHDLSNPGPPQLEYVPLEIVLDDEQTDLQTSPSLTTATTSTRALSISDLRNHYDVKEYVPDSNVFGHCLIEPDDLDTTPESVDTEFFRNTLVQVRSRQLPIPLVTLRTHKQARVRLKSRSRTRFEFEKDTPNRDLSSHQYRRIPVNSNT